MKMDIEKLTELRGKVDGLLSWRNIGKIHHFYFIGLAFSFTITELELSKIDDTELVKRLNSFKG